jgi:hypothetical protein
MNRDGRIEVFKIRYRKKIIYAPEFSNECYISKIINSLPINIISMIKRKT